MFSSTIIPTVGRPSLSRAVASLLNQNFSAADFEVIVVNDSGQPLPPAAWQQHQRVRLITTQRRERSVARNSGAAMARGEYLHFLDDDDWLGPDALQSIWDMAKPAEAGWFYGISNLVDRERQPLIRLHHQLSGNCFVQVMAGEWIPLQASFIRAEAFFAVGGFNPQLAGPEDIDLLRRVALTWELAETAKPIAYVIRGESGSTTDYDRHPQASRWAREMILAQAGVFPRLRASATQARWRGRIGRIYLTSLVWNVRRLRLFEALDRGWSFGRNLIASGADLLSPAFWQALVKSYASEAHARGLQEVAALSSGKGA
jgi:glycosyltransferase involved in cell wall biosynthesis